MRRWLRHSDPLIIATLAIGVFLFRYGSETWANVAPQLNRAQNFLSAQFDRLSTATTELPATPEQEPTVAIETPAEASPTASDIGVEPVFFPGHGWIVVSPGCPGEIRYGCHY